MYYVWEHDTKLTIKYAYFSTEPKGSDVSDWTSGKEMSQESFPMTLTSDEGRPTELSDLLLTSFNIQICSPRLVTILNDLGIKNIAYYPVKIINHETGEANGTYKVAHVIGKIACLDMDNSECSIDEDGDILWVKKFRIFEDKILSSKEIAGKPLLFRLKEFQFILLTHESVKERLEQKGITGMRFIKTEEYTGY